MRLVRLAKLAAQAEALRLKLFMKRQARRGIWLGAGVLFGLFFMVMLHLTVFNFLASTMAPCYAALVLSGFDLLSVAAFGLMAAKSSSGAQEREAAAISRGARLQMVGASAPLSMVLPESWKSAVTGNLVPDVAKTLQR